MTKLKKYKLSATLTFLGIAILAVGLISGVNAGWFNAEEVQKEVIKELVAEALNAEPIEPEQNLKGVSSELHLGKEVCSADSCTFSLTGELKSGTTTLFAIANPFRRSTTTASDVVIETLYTGKGLTGATSTVELVRIATNGTATTTYNISCGTAPTKYTTSTSGLPLLNTAFIVTSSPEYLIENNYGAVAASGALVATDSIAKIQIGSKYPYFVCIAQTGVAGDSGAFTDGGVSFSGFYTVKISRPRF